MPCEILDDVAIEDRLAMVDVELLVDSGAPRSVFELVELGPGWSWRLDIDALRRLGWKIDEHGMAPPARDRDIRFFSNHPYDMGPAWKGGGRWSATFGVGDRTVHAVVEHEILIDGRDNIDPGPPLASRSPWRWRIDGLTDSAQAGRAESPILAAAAVEMMLISEGTTIPDRTMTRRDPSTLKPMP